MRRILALAVVMCLASAAFADEDDNAAEAPHDEPAINLSSLRGLTGMREMIDARTPTGMWHIRAGAYFQYSQTEIDYSGDIRDFERERWEFTSFVGASFVDHVEVGFHWPFPQFEHTTNKVHAVNAPVPDPWPTVHDSSTEGGGGNFSFAAKAGWTFGPVSLAAYAIGQPSTGARTMAHKEDSFGELGGAGTVSFAKGLFAVHANVSAVELATRDLRWYMRYRTGFSVAIARSEAVVIRSFLYGEGFAHEAGFHSEYRLGAGVQALLLEHLQLEVTGDGRLVALLPDALTDAGTFEVAFLAGFVY
jgi:hypothetical protein